MDEIASNALKIIESHPQGILQCDLWRRLHIDSRKCSRVIESLLISNQITRTLYKKDGIKTFLIQPKKINNKIFASIELEYCKTHNCTFQQLIDEKRLITDGQIFKSSENRIITKYTILDEPLRNLLIADLMQKKQSLFELIEKYGIIGYDIVHEILWLRNNPYLFDQGYLLKSFPILSYQIVPIPLEVKIFDPFFGFSLLNWNELLLEFYDEIEILEKEDCFDEYSELISVHWNIPDFIVIENLMKTEFFFINSIFGPIPIIFCKSIKNQVLDMIFKSENVKKRNITKKNIDHHILKIDKIFQNDFGTVLNIQKNVIYLANIVQFCKNNSICLHNDKIRSLNERIFKGLFSIYYPNIDPIHENSLLVGKRLKITQKRLYKNGLYK